MLSENTVSNVTSNEQIGRIGLENPRQQFRRVFFKNKIARAGNSGLKK